MSVAALSHHGHDQLRLKLDLRVREVEAHEHVDVPAVAGSDDGASTSVEGSADSAEESHDEGELELSLRARIREDGDLRIRLKLEAEFEGHAAGRVIDELKLKIELRVESQSSLGELGGEANQLTFAALGAFGALLSGIADSLGQPDETQEGGRSLIDTVQTAFAEFSSSLSSIFGLSRAPALTSGDADPGSQSDGDLELADPVVIEAPPAGSESPADADAENAGGDSAPGPSLAEVLRGFLDELRSTLQESLEELRTLLAEGGVRARLRAGHADDAPGGLARYQIHIHGAASDDDAPDGVDLQA